MNAIATWLLTIMLAQPAPRDGEPPEARTVRLATIAEDIAAVSADRHEAVVLAALTHHESGWLLAVDTGARLGDGGNSYCVAQLLIGTGTTREGWTGAEVLADRRKCLTAAVHAMRRSRRSCRHLGPDAALRVYASGSCSRGVVESRAIMQTARRWAAR